MNLVNIICYLQILEGIPGYYLFVEFFLEMTFFLMEICAHGFVNLIRQVMDIVHSVMGSWIVILLWCKARKLISVFLGSLVIKLVEE